MRKKLKILGIITTVVALLLGSGALLPVAAAPDATVSIDAPDEAAHDSNFTANVNIIEVVDFDACNYDVSFDALVLELTSVASGLIGTEEIPVDIANELSPGTWTIVENVSGMAGVSGSGYLAVLHFHVIGAAGSSSTISLSNGMLSNNLAEEIPATWTGDTVSVSDTTPPTVSSTSPVADAPDVAVSTAVSATFSEAMADLTITTDSFTLDGVSGSVTYDSGTYTATFTPTGDLAYSTTYTATLSTAITDAAGNPLTSAHSWSFTTESAPPGAVIVSIDAPAEAAPDSDFTANVNISEVTDFDACNYDVSFDALVLELTSVASGLIGTEEIPVDIANEISPGTWTIVENVSGTAGVSGSGYLAVLHFHVIGAEGSSSTISLSNGMLSNILAEEIPATWTGDSVSVVGEDTTPPTVSSTLPVADDTGVAVGTAVSATFSEAMDELTLTTGSFTLDGVSGNVTYDSGTYTATFTPTGDLAANTTYTATLSTVITDAAGNPLAAAYSWSFTTTAGDTTPPTVVSTSPVADATDVAVDTVITATFSEAMDELTLTTGSFTLDGVSGSVAYDSGTYTATFTPSADLAANTTYTATLSTAITDAAGNPLASAYSWSFTTAMGSLQDGIDGTPPGGTLNLGCGTYSGDVTIGKPITITGSGECTIISGGITIGELTGSNVTLENLTITGYTDFGIKIVKVRAVDNFIIRNNVIQGISGSLVGIEVDEVVSGGSLIIEQNTISGNATGIKFMAMVADATIQFNNITGNTTGLQILAVGSDADASYNWWGDISGPEEANANPGGTGDKVVGSIGYQPWLTREFQTVLDDNIAYFGYAMVSVGVGWNIISTPIALDPGCDTWGEYVALGDGLDVHATSPAYYFDSQTQAWVALTSDYALKPCDAIYVRMVSADTAPILYSPNLSVPSKQLYSGWNLVGLAYIADVGLKADEALVSVEEVTGGLTGYRLVVSPSVNQPSWIYTGGAIADWGGGGQAPDGWMLRTNGYWVFMLNDGPLAGFTFTPVTLR